MGESVGRFASVSEVGSLAGALADLKLHSQRPGLVMLDLGLPDAVGGTALKMVVERCAEAPVLVVSGLDDPRSIDEAFALGARGYVPKNSSARTLRTAIETVLGGELYVPPHVLPSRAEAHRPLFPSSGQAVAVRLTRRQSDVLLHLSRGLSNKEIATELDMSLSTVRVHLSAVFKILGVENRTQAAMSSVARKLLGATEPDTRPELPDRTR